MKKSRDTLEPKDYEEKYEKKKKISWFFHSRTQMTVKKEELKPEK